jgi:hypothetical protein
MMESKCSCETCKGMCAHTSCVPTPKEARELIRRYPDRMVRFVQNGQRYIAPKFDTTNAFGPCTFFKDGWCELHDIGLKPLEGRISSHATDPRTVRTEVLNHWKGKIFESVEKQLSRHEPR